MVWFGLLRSTNDVLFVQERHPLEGADVSYEDINSREGKSWWQCLSCNPDPDVRYITCFFLFLKGVGRRGLFWLQLCFWDDAFVCRQPGQ